jgi:hypothetical protein
LQLDSDIYLFTVAKAFLFPERTIRGSCSFEVNEDKRIVPKLIRGRTRLFLPILPDTQHLSQLERIGLLYFVSLVFSFDSAIDTYPHIKTRIDSHSLETSLLNVYIEKADITAGELRNKTLNHFPPWKQEKLEQFWTDMITYQAHLAERVGEQKAGKYSYDEALSYRQATNDKWVEILCALRDTTAPDAITREKRRVFLIQLLDDARDWLKDIAECTYNLFVGLAAQHHREEFELMMRYSEIGALPQKDYHPLTRRQFMRRYMPHTTGAYLATFEAELKNVQCKATRLAYQALRLTV